MLNATRISGSCSVELLEEKAQDYQKCSFLNAEGSVNVIFHFL